MKNYLVTLYRRIFRFTKADKIALIVSAVVVAIGAIVLIWYMYLPPLTQNVSKAGTDVLEIDTWLAEISRKGKFSGSVSIAKNGETLLSKGYGNTENNSPVSAQTCIDVASLSKQFTAVAALQLVESTKLRLDQPIVEHDKNFPYEGVTLRHLLNHTSGIPDFYITDRGKYNGNESSLVTNDIVYRSLDPSRYPLASKPGTEFAYSNTGYVLAAHIVAQTAGVPFEQYVKDKIFTPLGMDNSLVWSKSSTTALPDSCSEGYWKLFSQLRPSHVKSFDGTSGDGAVYTSSEDMIKWDHAWRQAGSKVVTDYAKLEASKVPLQDAETPYGMGWVVQSDKMWHNGQWQASNSFYVKHANGISLFVVDNSTNHLRFQSVVDTIGEHLGLKGS